MMPAAASAHEPVPSVAPWRYALQSPGLVTSVLLVALVLVALIAVTIGAAGIPLERLIAAAGWSVSDPTMIERDRLVLWSIRLPRIVLAMMVGMLLAAGGTIMQGLFRNPLAEPGLVGVSAGAALAASTTIVLGDRLLAATSLKLPFEVLPFAAFVGALITTTVLYRIATREGRTSIATMLLAGIAIGALAQAAIGFLIFIADDRQLRDITFWSLGSLSGSTWAKVLAIGPFLALLLIALPLIARGLDLMVLGETEAFYMGLKVEQLKRICIVLVAAAAGAAVSVAGVIGFVGIIVPHLLRLILGPGHRVLLPASACFGGILLLAADTFARVLVAPAELPIGIVTAAIGAPFFLALLLQQRALIGP
jgi:iron complex transport system permease protein